MSCKFYGKRFQHGIMVTHGDNGCAVMPGKYSACAMDLDGETPNQDICTIRARALVIGEIVRLYDGPKVGGSKRAVAAPAGGGS